MADDQEKSHHPTQKKLDDARRKGEVVRSQEINVTVIYLAYVVCLFAFIPSAMQDSVRNLSAIWKEMAPHVGHNANPLNTEALGRAIKSTAMVIAVFFISLPASVIAVNIAQNSIIIVNSNIYPKLSRVSFITGFKNKFGSSGLFEFSKNTTKSALFCCAIYLSMKNNLEYFPSISDLNYHVGFSVIFNVVKEISLIVFIISLAISIIDYAWQKHTFTKKNMMSLQEIKDELKDSEGDPHFKGIRRQKAVELSSQHVMKDVPQSDVVIVNPTHYSIALKWTIDSGTAPIIVAMGIDHVALRIKVIAIENSIPIFEDIPTAKALTSTHNVGDEIRPEHYAAVAAAIRFAQKTKGISV